MRKLKVFFAPSNLAGIREINLQAMEQLHRNKCKETYRNRMLFCELDPDAISILRPPNERFTKTRGRS